jgi:outer membrane protein assembly factor BamB
MIQLGSGNLCTCSENGELSIYDYTTGEKIKSIELDIYREADVTSLLLLQDGRIWVSGVFYEDENSNSDTKSSIVNDDNDGYSMIFNIETGAMEQELQGYSIRTIQLADGEVFGCRNNGEINIWR